MKLGKELLGPRGGVREEICGKGDRLPPAPSNEYVVGVLEPKDFKRSPLAHFDRSDFLGDQESSRDEDPKNIEEEDAGAVNAPEWITPELDPRALPKSMGISFVVSNERGTKIGFCATWARYRMEEKCWKRIPYRFVVHGVESDTAGEWKPPDDPNVTIQIQTVKTANGFHVSLYFVNSTPVSSPKKLSEDELIFQPQLRIVLEEGTKLLPVRGHVSDGDSQDFGLLYRDRFALARGHMCGAVWAAIDPESPSPGGGPDEAGPLFSWVDGELVAEPDRSAFSKADLRTEFLPMYPVEQAVLTGPPEEKLEQISAELLSDSWEPQKLGVLLLPFIAAYGRWIEAKKREVSSLPEEYRKPAAANLGNCEVAMKRIQDGYDLLMKDDDARLAFCFMNRAMFQQSYWKDSTKPLKWFLFQMAFILQCLPGVANPAHPSRVEPSLSDREVCDLLWFPTGAGKTEAYLGLAAFTMALRRRKNRNGSALSDQAGTCVLSRYTLRLLTIQQFRRALNVVTACEYLRALSWLPQRFSEEGEHWGRSRFSLGLWVGASVSPNRLVNWGPYYLRERKAFIIWPGAVGELVGRERLRTEESTKKRAPVIIEGEESEPAQVLKCPACGGILAVSPTTLVEGDHELHWIVTTHRTPVNADPVKLGNGGSIRVTDPVGIRRRTGSNVYTISIKFHVAARSTVSPGHVETWWENVIKPAVVPSCTEEFARASRPGYFLRWGGMAGQPIDFEIRCPNPGCDLNKVEWSEHEPSDVGDSKAKVNPVFATTGDKTISTGMPIPAFTVDAQVYGRCPSMIVSTVDKFARLAFEPRAASIFGNVTRHSHLWGYYRDEAEPETGSLALGSGVTVLPLKPPSLIIQDELHLIEGPLGSMVGLYEAGIDHLASFNIAAKRVIPKYIASTATIRQAPSQVRALFRRRLAQFPSQGLSIEDSFFAISHEPHPLASVRPGRLYVGVCAPGRGAQTPIIRIMSSLLQEMNAIRSSRGAADKESDQFWTLVGYFNSKRELGGAVGLYKQDIRERIGVVAGRTGSAQRNLGTEPVELSGKTASLDIPGKLDRISKFPSNDVDAVFATAMFGTGVDIERLGLMVVDGQPKTTANYIQATGRVGRQAGGLVVTFLKAARPRDLDHYEFFTGYHRSLHRSVEPITVYPFSPRAMERGLGPLAVVLLRNASNLAEVGVPQDWAVEHWTSSDVVGATGSRLMAKRKTSAEVRKITELLAIRASDQPEGRKPKAAEFDQLLSSGVDRWELFAKRFDDELVYAESIFRRQATRHVVLGDPGHTPEQQVFRNAPQSLREVESTVTFDDEG
ncbi:MAG: DISARM system helicase DrmA [Nitrososphaerota archaeon]|nr:DISARM system helicase DrmA [Nitrososphaerota archaeon]